MDDPSTFLPYSLQALVNICTAVNPGSSVHLMNGGNSGSSVTGRSSHLILQPFVNQDLMKVHDVRMGRSKVTIRLPNGNMAQLGMSLIIHMTSGMAENVIREYLGNKVSITWTDRGHSNVVLTTNGIVQYQGQLEFYGKCM